MANVSRNVPPCAAVITIRPAAGGPSSTTVHSSGEKAALVVMACSCAPRDAGHVKNLAVLGSCASPRRGEVPRSGRSRSARLDLAHRAEAVMRGVDVDDLRLSRHQVGCGVEELLHVGLLDVRGTRLGICEALDA